MRDPTDQYDLPDHRSWQMNAAIDQKVRQSLILDFVGRQAPFVCRFSVRRM